MATIQITVPSGSNLDWSTGGTVTEATGGGAPTGLVDVNIANGASKEQVLRALDLAKAKVIQSQNLP